MEMVSDDTTDDAMQCTDHPYNKNPGGICAFCLQEKLGKLLSSSATVSGGANPFSFLRPHISSSSSDSPSFRSDYGVVTHKNKVVTSSSTASNGNFGGFKRSKSVASRSMSRVSDARTIVDTPRKKSFWSFLHLKQHKEEPKREEPVAVEESSSSLGRKVARSRSVGCGSRSFSGDFLERISTGFGDCTLRRVESHREHNNKKLGSNEVQRIKERVGCVRIFTGGGYDFDSGIVSNTARASTSAIVRGRNRSWGWAFASPLRSLGAVKYSSSKSYAPNNAIASINAANVNNGKIGANPSLLAVGR